VAIDLGGAAPEVRILRHADEQHGRDRRAPYGFDLDVAAGRWLMAARLGDLATGVPDALVAIDLVAGGSGWFTRPARRLGWVEGGLLVEPQGQHDAVDVR
jgi:hypothetical protein